MRLHVASCLQHQRLTTFQPYRQADRRQKNIKKQQEKGTDLSKKRSQKELLMLIKNEIQNTRE